MQIQSSLRPYEKVKADLSVHDGLVTFQDRIVVPASQRQEVIQKLHESHMGLTKCLEFAKQTVFWPGLRGDLKRLVESCHVCQQNRPNQRHEPLKPTELPSRPWSKVGADFCKHKGNNFLVVVDYYSRWIEIKPVKSMTSSSIILRFKQIFSMHGIPDVVVTDNGPPFNSRDFAQYAKEYGFEHHTSSPHFPQANGESESAVKIAKKLLSATDPDIAVMTYRTTPHSATGKSPSVMLNGRQLRTKVPVLPERLQPVSHNDREIRRADEKSKETYKKQYDAKHGARALPVLQPQDCVLIKTDDEKTWQDFGRILRPADASGRSYLIKTPTGVIRRNRKHLQQVPSVPDADDLPDPLDNDDEANVRQEFNPPEAAGQLDPEPQPPVQGPQRFSRYGRLLQRPLRYIEEYP